MSRPATFDHAEARRLYATGAYSQARLGEMFGVSATRIYQILDPERKARADRLSTEWSRAHYHQPCRECGTQIWKSGNRPNQTGLCSKCWGISKRTAEHGTETRYVSGCRCDDCRQAGNGARRARRRRPNVTVHNASGYANGCRCDICRAANTVKSREYYQRRKEAA